MDVGFGASVPLLYEDYSSSINAGIHFRGIYKKAESRLGLAVNVGVLYNYKYDSNQHGITLSPSIGLVF